MNAISSVLADRGNGVDSHDTLSIVPIGNKLIKPIVTIVETEKIKLSKDEVQGCDIGLSQFADLMHPDFYAWYCKAWYKIGRERFAVLASQARADGVDRPRLFSSLIKKELAK